LVETNFLVKLPGASKKAVLSGGLPIPSVPPGDRPPSASSCAPPSCVWFAGRSKSRPPGVGFISFLGSDRPVALRAAGVQTQTRTRTRTAADADAPWTWTCRGRGRAVDADGSGRRRAVDADVPWTRTRLGRGRQRTPERTPADADAARTRTRQIASGRGLPWTRTCHGRGRHSDAGVLSMTIFMSQLSGYFWRFTERFITWYDVYCIIVPPNCSKL
jgi:hypothetical protein